MSNTNKFLFDLNIFDTPKEKDVIEEIVEEEIEPPPPTFSEDELEAAKAVAQSLGQREGAKEELEKREQFIAETLQKISDNFSTLFAAEIYRERQYEEESLKLALEVIKLLAPSLNDKLGEEALKNTLKSTLHTQSEQAEVRIEVHPDTAPDIDALIQTIWPDKDITPRYKVVADSNLETGACAVSWKDGGMIRTPEKTANDIKVAIESLLGEQVVPKANSSLTTEENNAIKNQQPCESAPKIAPADQNGEKNE